MCVQVNKPKTGKLSEEMSNTLPPPPLPAPSAGTSHLLPPPHKVSRLAWLLSWHTEGDLVLNILWQVQRHSLTFPTSGWSNHCLLPRSGVLTQCSFIRPCSKPCGWHMFQTRPTDSKQTPSHNSSRHLGSVSVNNIQQNNTYISLRADVKVPIIGFMEKFIVMKQDEANGREFKVTNFSKFFLSSLCILCK